MKKLFENWRNFANGVKNKDENRLSEETEAELFDKLAKQSKEEDEEQKKKDEEQKKKDEEQDKMLKDASRESTESEISANAN